MSTSTLSDRLQIRVPLTGHRLTGEVTAGFSLATNGLPAVGFHGDRGRYSGHPDVHINGVPYEFWYTRWVQRGDTLWSRGADIGRYLSRVNPRSNGRTWSAHEPSWAAVEKMDVVLLAATVRLVETHQHILRDPAQVLEWQDWSDTVTRIRQDGPPPGVDDSVLEETVATLESLTDLGRIVQEEDVTLVSHQVGYMGRGTLVHWASTHPVFDRSHVFDTKVSTSRGVVVGHLLLDGELLAVLLDPTARGRNHGVQASHPVAVPADLVLRVGDAPHGWRRWPLSTSRV